MHALITVFKSYFSSHIAYTIFPQKCDRHFLIIPILNHRFKTFSLNYKALYFDLPVMPVFSLPSFYLTLPSFNRYIQPSFSGYRQGVINFIQLIAEKKWN